MCVLATIHEKNTEKVQTNTAIHNISQHMLTFGRALLNIRLVLNSRLSSKSVEIFFQAVAGAWGEQSYEYISLAINGIYITHGNVRVLVDPEVRVKKKKKISKKKS